jgi:DNA polymerase-1
MIDLAANADKALRIAAEAHDISYDTETSGVDWRFNNPVGYVLGAPGKDGVLRQEDVVYVPVRHGGGGNLLDDVKPLQTPTDPITPSRFETALGKAFAARPTTKGRIIGHNIKFDCHMSANAGIYLGRRMACTQLQEALLDEYTKSFSLDSCAQTHGVTAKLGQDLYNVLSANFGGPAERSSMQYFWRIAGNDPTAYDYATGDGVSTWELYQSQVQKLQEEDLQLVTDLENDLIWTVFRMERRGIRVDRDRIDQLRQATEARIRELLTKFPVGFNVRSPKMMKEAMEAAGHTDWPTTERGNPSFTEKWLSKHDTGRAIIDIRRASNLLNSFVGPLEERHLFKGRVHATLNQLKSDQMGTISGRFSCNSPNLQQVPKRVKEVAKPFRRLFVADEGYIFWERDYSQCEPRLFAHYSQDPNLLDGYNSEPFVDAHSVTAKLLGVERDPTAKRMNMGILTGMQVRALAGHMGCSEAEARIMWNNWYAAYPGIRQFQDKAKTRLQNRGYVHTLLGRRGRLEHRRFAYRGVSKIIQGSNADIVKYKLLEADRLCEDNGDIVQVHMTVHDSYNGQYQDTPEARKLFEHMVHRMEQVQEEPFNLSVPFVMEGEEGGDWCEATFGVDD